MGISNQKQVIKMKHFKFILFFLICCPLIRAQECTSGNCKNGFGTLENKTTTYTGNFKESRMHGKGEYVWKDGGSYKGDFREGFFEGIWTLERIRVVLFIKGLLNTINHMERVQ